ncbi:MULTISPECIES: pyridoxal-dependent aspartate 1-decarboxylase PanP [Idiomarina]|uniref:Pyridoxal-dependent aspartate 1-decarboxylase n=2 Tax=Idiomarina abyssalis TaxID=86102 RepID=A0A8I1KJ32_9GAMM|nr:MULTISPECIES: putative pyridoxal-dependent aspartate 1-decarboxylase [Idiomarina]KPD21525.1 glutamate decarboxylase [Idiomarina abyssalis]MAO68215.1 putative pyridoxal-dependent aspartate 1-decarboxylase [Idiomarina sp.]MBF81396.1 putative pyridoxal-dependent aspartate 1-decarboxylase [Idiomarina sp.]MBH94181.1 putative pyridoxal-dependent aspartate 1-decarboxylase [Idiomarina sp.]MBJ7266651.1 putative pyridoxal-dependent aspartate 1-decarboxylase [Idiomarina abyssalis]
MSPKNDIAEVSQESLYRIFTIPEAPDSTLGKIEKHLSENLMGFLGEHIVAREKPLQEIERDFDKSQIPEEPQFVSDHTEFLLDKLVAHSVHTASPRFIGHMTSALPYFLLPLAKLMVGLNQNLVKIETSKAFTPLERNVIGMLHHLVYQQDAPFYNRWMHSAQHSLGAFCSGGTIANMTALWVARNRLLQADGDFAGIAADGLAAGLQHYGYSKLTVVVSERGHYSLSKAADVLGIGRKNLVSVATDSDNRIRIDELRKTCEQIAKEGGKVLALVGVAGTTETGHIDPLDDMATVAEEVDAHFHVDAAWGGATLLSEQHRPLLAGIERADSVTIDAHKQMYVPMGAGLVLFKNPSLVKSIEHHAEYIIRQGSKDLGSHSMEGSRAGMAMMVFSAMHVIGRRGYELLINNSIDKARYFSKLIAEQDDFEVITEPELCILTYRFVPAKVKAALEKATPEQLARLTPHLNALTRYIQKRQRESGQSFVSRTKLTPGQYHHEPTVVFRVVLANPLTTDEMLQEVLNEQRQIASKATSLRGALHTEMRELGMLT